MPATLSFRVLRATAFAVVCLALSVTAHLAGGGTLPVLWALGGLALVFGAALPLSGRERAPGMIVPLLAGFQVVLHLMFSVAGPAAGTAGVPDPGGLGHPHSGLFPGLGMLIAHGWAVVLTGLWLSHGEAALWGLLRRLGVRLRLALAFRSGPGRGAAPVIAAGEPHVPHSAVLRHIVSRRGPPGPMTTACRRPSRRRRVGVSRPGPHARGPSTRGRPPG